MKDTIISVSNLSKVYQTGSVKTVALSDINLKVDKGDYVEVAKGTELCPGVILDKLRRIHDPENVYWRVTSKARANGTQAVSAIVLESLYDRKSGKTTIKESRYDEDYATFFKRSPEQKEMLFMISPKDGRMEETVEICKKKK